MKKFPTISVNIPFVNEEKTIRKCLDSILEQNYPGKIEIILANSRSTDSTLKIIKEYMQKHKNIKFYNNPKKNTAIGRNICLKHSHGELVQSFSGHMYIPKNFLKVLAGRLVKADKDVAGIGCSIKSPEQKTFASKLIDVIFRTPLGGSNSFEQNISHKTEKYVDSIPAQMYKRRVVEKVGGYDPDLWVGQDSELNLRLRLNNHRLLYTPKTFAWHYKRTSFSKFFRQMYRYGWGRYRILQKHPSTFRISYMIPPLFSIGVLALIFLSYFPLFRYMFSIAIVLYYLIGLISASLVTKSPAEILISPFFYFIEHFAYGLGFLKEALASTLSK